MQTAIVPLLVAGGLYLFLSYVLLPIYRRYRADIARYSQYAPLSSTLQSTTSIFSDYIPESLRPRSIRDKLGDFFVRLILPSMWAIRNRGRANQDRDDGGGSSSDDEDGGLFDEESGERMIGFDMNQGRRTVDGRRTNQERVGNRGTGETDAMDNAIDDSNRRLSRELEEGFRDDSGSEDSDEEVTVGRRRLSIAGNQ